MPIYTTFALSYWAFPSIKDSKYIRKGPVHEFWPAQTSIESAADIIPILRFQGVRIGGRERGRTFMAAFDSQDEGGFSRVIPFEHRLLNVTVTDSYQR